MNTNATELNNGKYRNNSNYKNQNTELKVIHKSLRLAQLFQFYWFSSLKLNLFGQTR